MSKAFLKEDDGRWNYCARLQDVCLLAKANGGCMAETCKQEDRLTHKANESAKKPGDISKR